MGQRCCVCGTETIFIIWSSSRDFPRKELSEKTGIPERILKYKGRPVCFKCKAELDKMRKNDI